MSPFHALDNGEQARVDVTCLVERRFECVFVRVVGMEAVMEGIVVKRVVMRMLDDDLRIDGLVDCSRKRAFNSQAAALPTPVSQRSPPTPSPDARGRPRQPYPCP